MLREARMKLTDAELRLVLFAIDTAIASEHEFIDCHRGRHTGKVFDDPGTRKVVAQARLGMRRMRKLAEKIAKHRKAT
jgi:hypothetical protein